MSVPDYRSEAIKRMQANMDGSAFMLALGSEAWMKDPICWAQLGYAVMIDKPILLMLPEGLEIPRNVKRLALRIERYTTDEDMEFAAKRLIKYSDRYVLPRLKKKKEGGNAS